jgi:hypothetical protein
MLSKHAAARRLADGKQIATTEDREPERFASGFLPALMLTFMLGKSDILACCLQCASDGTNSSYHSTFHSSNHRKLTRPNSDPNKWFETVEDVQILNGTCGTSTIYQLPHELRSPALQNPSVCRRASFLHHKKPN